MNINKVRREPVTIDIGDGVERVIKYTLNSFALMEETYGSVDKALKEMENGSIKAVRFMLWVGLLKHDPEVTEEYVGGVIDILDMEDIAEKMNQVMNSNLPDKDATDPNA